LADPEHWNERQFEIQFFTSFIHRSSVSDEEYEHLVEWIADTFSLPF